MSFLSDIRKFNSNTEEAATEIVRGTALTLFGKVILRTPVLTGRARANWQASIQRPANGVVDKNDKSGRAAMADAKSTVGKMRLGESILLVNNLDYIGDLENGTSKKSPEGMVKVTVAEFQQVVSREARK